MHAHMNAPNFVICHKISQNVDLNIVSLNFMQQMIFGDKKCCSMVRPLQQHP
jgi:hypothetical protein